MLEINKKQLLMFDEVNRARILKYIALGLIKYKVEEERQMIIVNQDKNAILNFDNTTTIKTEEQRENYTIVARVNNGHIATLGEYATEERAKEVLQEILKYYNSLKRKSVYAIGDGNFTFSEKFYYEMPKE